MDFSKGYVTCITTDRMQKMRIQGSSIKLDTEEISKNEQCLNFVLENRLRFHLQKWNL